MKQLADLTVSLFLLAGFMPLFSADKPGWEGPYYVVAGQSFTLPLGYNNLGKDDRLVWMYNQGVMYKSKANENKCSTDVHGSLLLPAKLLAVAGEKHNYTAEVHDGEGILKHKLKTSIHLLAEVPTPTMEVDCLEKTVVFTCNVSERQDLVIKWTVGNNKESLKAIKTLTKQKDFKELVMCTVSNNASTKSSQKVSADSCPQAPILPPDILLIVYCAAGGVVFLIIITIACCVRACQRKKNRQQKESEMRLEWTKQATKEDQQQQQHQKKKTQPKKKAQHQQGGPNPHSCKSSGEPHRPRTKDTTANPLAGTKPGRTRPSPRPPQQERDMAVVQMDHGPPLPKPRKKKANNPGHP